MIIAAAWAYFYGVEGYRVPSLSSLFNPWAHSPLVSNAFPSPFPIYWCYPEGNWEQWKATNLCTNYDADNIAHTKTML